jgi:N-acetylglucosaminyldiphosphoundecaprenol N-acetyl-beta-D-mannosaminyltransferase
MQIALKSETLRDVRFLGLELSNLNFDDVIAEVLRRAGEQVFSYIVTPNTDHVVKLFPRRPGPHTEAFRKAYECAALRVCDSRTIQRLARVAGVEIPLVPGSDLTSALFAHVLKKGCRVALVGGASDTVAVLEAMFPGPEYLQHVPPMGVLSNASALNDIVEFVGRARPNVTLLAFGAPQSEIVAHKCRTMGGTIGVGLCIGASIDFLIGRQKRAPMWMQKAGLEWLHRLASDPARMWRRYLVEDMRIFWLFASRNRNKA